MPRRYAIEEGRFLSREEMDAENLQDRREIGKI